MNHWPYPLWIAHRGAGSLAPENTLAAFRLGATHGWRAFECDVKLSADDVPFLLHDATLQRTTDRQGSAGALRWEALSRIDAGSWHSRAYAGEPLPSLGAIAAFVQANGCALNIEIKPTPGTESHTGAVVAAQAARLWHGQPLTPLLSSFAVEALRGARDSAPHLRRALLLDKLWTGALDMAKSLGCAALVVDQGLMDGELVARIHDAGMRALVYTVNDAARARALLALGIDGIISDAVEGFATDARASEPVLRPATRHSSP
jgi:glycerophosphoryl diester phosphodiesterase